MSVFVPFRRHLSRAAVGASLLSGLVAAVPAVIEPASVVAQEQAFRTIDGKVVDKDSKPLKGAVVYLKDGHTLAVKSYIAGDDGGYHFGQLSTSTDFSLWAESGGKKSGTKSISSFDARKDVDFTLKIDK